MNKNPQKDAQAETKDHDTRWRELPMPKGSELYPIWSQALLRAARAGRILQRNSKANEEDRDGAEDEDAEGDLDTSFVANRWNQLPREAEEPEAEYLAKRRRGLPTLYGGWATDGANVTMRKCKIKKIDAEGNAYLLEVLIPEGTTIDGEYEEQEDLPIQTPAVGTRVEGLGIANAEGVIVANEHMMPTPPRRRPPIPKRKPKGPGRGRKKKIIIEDGANGAPTAVNAVVVSGSDSIGVPSMNIDGAVSDGHNEDTNHAEADAEADDGSEDDDEDGEDGDENDREDGEMSDGDGESRSVSPTKVATKRATKPTPPAETDISSPLLSKPAAIPKVQIISADSSTIPDPAEAVTSVTSIIDAPLLPAIEELAQEITKDEDLEMSDVPVLLEEAAIQAQIAALPEEELIKVAEPETEANAEIEAKLPAEHNLLDGLIEPQAISEGEVAEIQDSKNELVQDDTTMEDNNANEEIVQDNSPPKLAEHTEESSKSNEPQATGEDDIFGSLERHLDKKDE